MIVSFCMKKLKGMLYLITKRKLIMIEGAYENHN